LPETTAGLALMVDWQADQGRLAASFAEMAVEALRDMRHNPAAAAARRDQRIKFIRDHYLWGARALEWEQWLTHIASAPRH
jgi:hypothetical protein